MSQERADDSSDLATQLADAIDSYHGTWEPVDSELYELCRRRPGHRNFADVFTKVAIIGRVYNAGLDRAWRGRGDPESETARCIISQAEMLDEALAGLRSRPLDRTTVIEIVGLHGTLTRALSLVAGDVWLISPVSKYLHFHCPIVPVYDSRAEENIRRLVDWPDVYRVQASMAQPEDWARAYYRFATAFVILYERIQAETSLRPTVKEVDYLLWAAPD